MPAVIQRLFTPGGAEMPIVQAAVRVEELFADRKWDWSADLDAAHVFPTYEAADAEARAIGAGVFPVIRPAPDYMRRERILADENPDGTLEIRHLLPSAEGSKISDAEKARLQKKARHFERSCKELATRHVSPAEAYERLVERHLD